MFKHAYLGFIVILILSFLLKILAFRKNIQINDGPNIKTTHFRIA